VQDEGAKEKINWEEKIKDDGLKTPCKNCSHSKQEEE